MELTLFYRGELGSNKGAKQKQKLRQTFHQQLSMFWEQTPLKSMRWLWEQEHKLYKSHCDITKHVGDYKFIPIVNKSLCTVADINIELLRSEPPGTTKTQSGDLDNRVKTLLDALRSPKIINELPKDSHPESNETPFFCLLEDDDLIHRFSVTSRRWLEPNISSREVILVINIKTSITNVMTYNESFSGNIV